ncbi:hypothetical protein [Vibrio jasicida]|uniref:hypothetical protein n=1 Tax=Vibrio jasicida TaxID=766224 RepID=UPI0005EFE164|nr:hypothetical protein [Vibrio jasicida]
MKADLNKRQASEKQAILQAFFQLKHNSHNFEVLLRFIEACLEDRKVALITCDSEHIQRLQGEAEILKSIFDLIDTAETEHSKM